jgi:phage protein U
MSDKSNHQDQLILKAKDNSFKFVFSTKEKDLYISNLSQSVDYGWKVIPNQADTQSGNVFFQRSNNENEITLHGFIFSGTEIGCGIDDLTKLKNMCEDDEKLWYLLVNKTNKTGITKLCHVRTGALWYIINITINSSNFNIGLNANKISFSITLKKYNI